MGCLRSLVAQVGCLLVLVALAFFGWVYREQAADVVRRLRGQPPRADVVWVQPAPAATDAAAGLAQLARRGGPAYVDLSAADVGALLDAALARTGRRVVDSVRIGLLEDELRISGSLDLSGIPRSALGPFQGALGAREPVVIGGPLAVDSSGRLVMEVTTLRVKDFPFPRSTIPALVRQLRIPGVEGSAVPVPGITGVGDVRVTAQRVRFYRSAQR
jgi:hypothetical protein